MKWQSMSNLLGKEQITNKQHQETGFPQKVFITKKYDTQPGSTTTSTTLRDDKTIPEGRKDVCKPVQKTCRSKLLTPKRKL